jgi:very-short-patch-repair endonuclease
VDFCCHRADPVVEVDGEIHDLQQAQDTRREKASKEPGLRAIRLRNEDVLNDLLSVPERIKEQGR